MTRGEKSFSEKIEFSEVKLMSREGAGEKERSQEARNQERERACRTNSAHRMLTSGRDKGLADEGC